MESVASVGEGPETFEKQGTQDRVSQVISSPDLCQRRNFPQTGVSMVTQALSR
jgi:hypothetical protein